MAKAKASYDYLVQQLKSVTIIGIIDLDKGTSVTNDIENVVEEIGEAEDIDPKECLIVYRDSFELWDGWDHKTQSFVPLQCRTLDDALNKLMSRQVA